MPSRRGYGPLQANGHPNGSPWRQWYCTACKGYFLETHGTPFYGKRVTADLLVGAVSALAAGLGIRAVARVFEIDPNTVLQWLVEAAAHLQAFSAPVLHNVHVTQVQLDELYALLRAVKDGAVSEAEALTRLSRSPRWVWAGFPLPEERVIVAHPPVPLAALGVGGHRPGVQAPLDARRPYGDGAWAASRIAWCSALWPLLSRCSPFMVSGSIRPSLSASI